MRLPDLITEYQRNYLPKFKCELRWYANRPTLRDAIDLAARARWKEGKKLSHQWHIKNETLQIAASKLILIERQLVSSTTFNDIIERVEANIRSIWGIGSLTIYDTSLRIGAKIGNFPTEVYLHAGAKDGARKLLGETYIRGKQKISKSSFSRHFEILKPCEIENFLCVMRKQLQ